MCWKVEAIGKTLVILSEVMMPGDWFRDESRPEIPSELGHIANLISADFDGFVDVSENQLSGGIPSEVISPPQL